MRMHHLVCYDHYAFPFVFLQMAGCEALELDPVQIVVRFDFNSRSATNNCPLQLHFLRESFISRKHQLAVSRKINLDFTNKSVNRTVSVESQVISIIA